MMEISHLNDKIYYDSVSNVFRSGSLEEVQSNWYLMDNSEYQEIINKRNNGYEVYSENGKPKLKKITFSSDQIISAVKFKIQELLELKSINLGFKSFNDATSYNRDEFEPEKAKIVRPLMLWRSKLNKFIDELDCFSLSSTEKPVEKILENLPEYSDVITDKI